MTPIEPRMKLWLFTFTQSDRPIVSARIAAYTRDEAVNLMGGYLGRPLISDANTHPEPGTILQYFGNTEEKEGIVSLITPSGMVMAR